MDSLFENIKLYCGILKKCSLSEVGKWRTEDLDRAFHWADYFDKALVRISKRKSVIAKVDAKLREFGQNNSWTMGGVELNFESFQQSSQYLLKTLLGNTHLPGELREKLLSRSKPESEGVQKVKFDDVSASHTDRPLVEGRAEPLSSDQQLSTIPCDTLSLLKHIQTIQRRDALAHSFSAVCEQLDVLSKRKETTDIILKSLVEILPDESFDDTKKVILHWLLERVKHPEYQQRIWQQSPELLANISCWYLDFFREHLKYLASETEKLETISVGPTSGQEDTLQIIANRAIAEEELDRVVSHFVALSQTNQDVKEVCVLFVKSKALKHTTLKRFSYSSPLTTCVWSRLLSSLST